MAKPVTSHCHARVALTANQVFTGAIMFREEFVNLVLLDMAVIRVLDYHANLVYINVITFLDVLMNLVLRVSLVLRVVRIFCNLRHLLIHAAMWLGNKW